MCISYTTRLPLQPCCPESPGTMLQNKKQFSCYHAKDLFIAMLLYIYIHIYKEKLKGGQTGYCPTHSGTGTRSQHRSAPQTQPCPHSSMNRWVHRSGRAHSPPPAPALQGQRERGGNGERKKSIRHRRTISTARYILHAA